MSSAVRNDSDGVPSLLDLLLAEQQSLPAVETFARRHLEEDLAAAAEVYEERIPLDRPLEAGQQLAFQVDLDACTGCKACVTACHSMNGLATDEIWRDVGLVVGHDEVAAVQQTVTTACHHCEDPACLAGCPVQAYEKDVVTGIVRHLDDQCIGCQYCVLKCPYDVPKYSEELKIVRKCDMCTGRLAVGEAPACVQGCPNGAITIQVVDQIGSDAPPELISGLEGAIPDSAYTRPTTRYVSTQTPVSFRPADLDHDTPADAHDPLAIMLVLLQTSVGTLVVSTLASMNGLMSDLALSLSLAFSAVAAVFGMGAATMHLGRPLYAFRAFLGWRTSWMSREIIAVGAYVPAIGLTALASIVDVPRDVFWILQSMAVGVGLLATLCSMMIYVDTHRRAWALSRTLPIFLGTLLGLGSLGVAATMMLAGWLKGQGDGMNAVPLLVVGISILVLKIGGEIWQVAKTSVEDEVALARGRRLMRGPLRRRVSLRFVFAAIGFSSSAMSWALLSTRSSASGAAAVAMMATLLFFALGEFVERHLYFTSEASPGMPGR